MRIPMKAAVLAMTFLAAVSCGPTRRAASTLPVNPFPDVDQGGKVAIVAHRGFWKSDAAQGAQNSIAALKAAQDNGFWGSEFDIRLTKDGVVVVNHDPDLQGMKIVDHTYEQLLACNLANGEKIPTLDEYLAQGKKSRKTRLVVEFKDMKSPALNNELVTKTLDAIKAHGLFDPSRVLFISFNHDICLRIAREAPAFINQYLNGNLSPDTLAKEGINGIDYNESVIALHPKWPSDCAALGMSSNVWTVDSESGMKAMVEAGAGAITTNEPLKLREILGKNECR